MSEGFHNPCLVLRSHWLSDFTVVLSYQVIVTRFHYFFQVIGQSVGLYGRDVVTFALGHGSMKHPVQLPSSTISTGNLQLNKYCSRGIIMQNDLGLSARKTVSELTIVPPRSVFPPPSS